MLFRSRTIGQGVLSQLLITNDQNTVRIGLVVCYQVDYRNRHAYIALQGSRNYWNTGILIEAIEIFIEYLFRSYGFEKLYAEVPGFNFPRLSNGLGKWFAEEGRLVNHEYFFERFWDLHLLAVHRSSWNERQIATDTRGARLQVVQSEGVAGLGFDEFVDLLGKEMEIEGLVASPTSDLHRDLHFDSMDLVELMEILVQLGAEPSIEEVASFRTLAEVHFQYLQSRGA